MRSQPSRRARPPLAREEADKGTLVSRDVRRVCHPPRVEQLRRSAGGTRRIGIDPRSGRAPRDVPDAFGASDERFHFAG